MANENDREKVHQRLDQVADRINQLTDFLFTGFGTGGNDAEKQIEAKPERPKPPAKPTNPDRPIVAAGQIPLYNFWLETLGVTFSLLLLGLAIGPKGLGAIAQPLARSIYLAFYHPVSVGISALFYLCWLLYCRPSARRLEILAQLLIAHAVAHALCVQWVGGF